MEDRRHRTSYLSEHTIEFYLVPRFRQTLAADFRFTLAFYFWASREGSSASRSVCAPERVRLVAVYPRRPKLGVNRGTPVMKVNAELFRCAAEFRRVGVPVFAGFPLVRSVFEFSGDVEFLWFALLGDETEGDIEVEMRTITSDQSSTPSLQGPLSDQDVCRLFTQESEPMPWDRAIEAINRVRRQEADNGLWPLGRGYKPVYFLAW